MDTTAPYPGNSSDGIGRFPVFRYFGTQVVRRQTVAHAPEDGVLVRALGELGQVLADLDAGHVGGDRLEFTPELARSVRLQVERIHVRWAAPQVDEDRRGGLPSVKLTRFGQLEIVRQRQAGCADDAHPQEVAATDAVAIPV